MQKLRIDGTNGNDVLVAVPGGSIIYAANNGLLDDIEQKDIQKFKAEWFKFLAAQSKDLEGKINTGDKLSKEDETALTDAIKNFKTNFFNK